MPRQVFYKYMMARVAKIVLETRHLRYSSPLAFNDPFDITRELRLDFDAERLLAALGDRVAWLLEHADATTRINHPTWGPLIRKVATLEPDARRKIASDFRKDRPGATPGAIEALNALKAKWSALVPTFRVLCLSEVNDAAPMWNHYADKYRGVVLGFFAAEGVDSVFTVARPVVYQAAPSIAHVETWVNLLLGEGDVSFNDLIKEYLYVKTPDWSYEKEWRIPVPGRRPTDDERFGDYGFYPSELIEIYFGPQCADTDRADFIKLLANGLDHVKRYEMVTDGRQARLVARPLPH